MGYLMKEFLKIFCGVNQWSYAVFWKIGCQNPKLLIWEECYYGSASCQRNGNPEYAFHDSDSSFVSTETIDLQSNIQAGNKVHLLLSKMMMDNHVNIVGEGLVGRAAFTGNHQWILTDNYYKESYPPEVLKEVCQQFSAGMQTIAVIPVLPHGVFQLGSHLTIAENMGFVNDVVSLVLQLAYIPGFLQFDNYAAKELAPKTEVPECPGYSTPLELPLESNMIEGSSLITDCFNYVGCSSQTSVFGNQTSYSLAGDWHEQFMNGVAKAEVIPSNSDIWINRYSSLHNSASVKDLSSSSLSTLNHGSVNCTQQNILSDNVSRGHFMSPLSSDVLISSLRINSDFISSYYGGSYRPSIEANGLYQGASSNTKPVASINSLSEGSEIPNLRGLTNLNLSKMESAFSDSVDLLTTNSLPSYSQNVHLTQHNEHLKVEDDGSPKIEAQIHPVNNINCDDACFQPQSGDGLFDILGDEFKNKFFSSHWSGFRNGHNSEKNNSPSRKKLASSEIYPNSQGNSDSGIFSLSGIDNLLDAVVSKVHPSYNQSLDDNVSCRTTLTDTSSTSASKVSHPYGQFPISLWAATKEDRTYLQNSCVYDSWNEKGHNMRQNNGAPTGYSNKPNEKSKTNRKRLKPGENPRPRPKDRQMIQDRLKELREIVPKGAKCSIDALLERTIKHMLFLQSVTKHANKLKQTAVSKIISKDGSLHVKDNCGGATWAYEIGSESMICPIIVEDLDQPRQMLIEMLCEERGSFLEIADVIRGLGLTILKGLMETRNDKTWARFVVEADRDVIRMEIFLSLVRLLEQNAKIGVPPPDKTSNTNTSILEFHQATSICASDCSFS